jgi:hypothetical protein
VCLFLFKKWCASHDLKNGFADKTKKAFLIDSKRLLQLIFNGKLAIHPTYFLMRKVSNPQELFPCDAKVKHILNLQTFFLLLP